MSRNHFVDMPTTIRVLVARQKQRQEFERRAGIIKHFRKAAHPRRILFPLPR